MKKNKQNEFIIYAHEKTDFTKRPPKGSIVAQMPHGLYSIETTGHEILPEMSLINNRPIWLDMIWF